MAKICRHGVAAWVALALFPACGGSGSDGPLTVSGTVSSAELGAVSGAEVRIGSARSTTDSSGHFNIPNVVAPYDLVVVLTAARAATIYEGLTRADPTVFVDAVSLSSQKIGRINGQISGGSPPGNGTVETWVTFASSDPSVRHVTEPVDPPSFEYEVRWYGPSSAVTGNLRGLKFESSNGLASRFLGYGVNSGVRATAGETIDASISLSAVTWGTISGAVTVPGGVTLSDRLAGIRFPDGAILPVGSERAPSSSTFSYLVPDVPGGAALVFASGFGPGGERVFVQVRDVPQAASNVQITLPPPVSALLPIDGATGIGTSADFSWTPIPGGNVVYTFSAFPTGGGSNLPSFVIVTGATSVRLPDLSSEALGLPSSVEYSWSVSATGPQPSVDSAAGPSGVAPTGSTLAQGSTLLRLFTTP